MVNRGVAPLDITTDIGLFRMRLGDVNYVPLSPPETGFGDYNYFSDNEITGFILAGGGSITQGLGYATMQWALAAANESKSITDYDLKVDYTKRAAELRATAQMYFDLAGNESDADEFLIAGSGIDDCDYSIEGATNPYSIY